jgi:uncharacterized membrane protein YjgN (DUF898 family)
MADSGTDQGVQPRIRVLSDSALFYLEAASPWLRFLGIVSYIACGLMVLAGLVMVIAAPLLAEINGDDYTGFLTGIILLVSAVLEFFPARFAYSFGARLRNFFLSNAERDIEIAFKYNKSYWKFCGIMMIIALALIPIGISLAIYVYMAGYF